MKIRTYMLPKRFVLALSLFIFALVTSAPTVSALSGSDFNAGRIIDDSVFYEPGSMSVADIQSFLNAKGPTCDTKGSQTINYRYNSSTRKVGIDTDPSVTTSRALYTYRKHIYVKYYRENKGFSPENAAADPTYPDPPTPYQTSPGAPYPSGVPDAENSWFTTNTNMVCLKSYYENKATHATNYATGIMPSDALSAAQIIYDRSQYYGISPKVFLVLLQKEQSLVTDDWPWPIQYRAATGYGCPDTAACSASYYGFYNQIDNAARQFIYYKNNASDYGYRAGRNNTIGYNPNSACGSSQVYIENQATAGLYIYTPYQPNAAALSNLYGTGDGCSAYGNRNFWRMFNDWFGSTSGPAFHATYQSQSPYPIIDTGNGISVFFQFKNTGRAFWKDDMSTFPGYYPVRLATSWPINRASAFRADNWLAPGRATGTFSKVYESDGVTLAAEQHTVQPGQIARFEFTIHVDPSIPGGVYREYFQPILEGAPGYSWNMGGGVYLDIGVNKPNYKATFHSQSSYPTVSRGTSTSAMVRFSNSGLSPWYDDTTVWPGKNPIHLASTWPINRGSVFSPGWPRSSRPALVFNKVYESDGITLSPQQHVVNTGQIAEFSIPIVTTGETPTGVYKEYFEPIAESAPLSTWSLGSSAWLSVTVN